MRTRISARERLWLGGTAFAALVGAHALTFFLAAPAHHDRAELLHDTGHGSWTSIFILAGAALLAAAVALSNRWASPHEPVMPTRRLLGYAWRRLLPLQILGFIALECAERGFAHGSPVAALAEPVVWVGVVLQVLTALACGLLLVAFTRLVGRLRSARTRIRTRAVGSFEPSTDAIAPRSLSSRAWNVRGPPALPRPC